MTTFNVPMFLTWCRVAAIPVLVGIYYTPDSWLSPHEKNLWATILYVAAGITDWLDGYLARKWRQESAFGAFLDPVADKLLVTVALILLAYMQRVEPWIAIVIVGREMTVTALREWMASVGAQKKVAVSFAGKVKTTFQLVAIPMLLFSDSILGVSMLQIGYYTILIATVATLWSMAIYLAAAARTHETLA